MANKLDISAVIIYATQDAKHLSGCLDCIPKDIGIVLCNTIPIPTGQPLPKHEVQRLSERTTNVKYYYEEGKFSFSRARNYAKSLTDSAWILSLDADDRLMYEPGEFEQLATLPPDIAGVNVIIISPCPEIINENELALSATWDTKIFRNKSNINWQYNCHETVVKSIQENGLRIAPSDIIIKHIGYINATSEDWDNKLIRNYNLLSKDIIEYKDDKFIFYKYLQTLQAIAAKFIIKTKQCI